MGKSRVAPLKPVTIPRLELTTAVCSVRISQQLHRELEYRIDKDFFWTDSKVVLGYISNESRRFHVFVSNRVQEIQDSTHRSQWPLTPNHLLTMKSRILLSPPGKFEPADMYARKRWRRVQHLANEFWARWRKEYLLSLQERQKWTRPRRNLRVGNVVMIKDTNLPRNAWQPARVATVHPSTDGQVRKVQVALADACLDKKGRRSGPMRYLERPVQKLVLLVPSPE